MLELYSARQRAAFVTQASEELGVDEQMMKHDLGRVLLELERLQDAQIREALEPKDKPIEMTEDDREQALRLLRDPNLIETILADFERAELIGEEVNKLIAYLAVTSRKLDEPLAIVIQSSSASGKSSLLERVLDFVPEEERMRFSAMTGQSLYYLGETELAHKVLAVAEEAGAHRASYALKLLQSDGELRIASTGKDPGTGRLITQEYTVRGPVALMFTTTNIDLDPELANRCVVLAVDEGREQTRRIHDQQRHRQTLEGVLARHDRELRLHLHRNAQRLLRPLTVVNPFVSELGFNDDQTRSRRDHAKYLTLIRTVALLHQYQRPVKAVEHAGHRFEYIEVERQDIELADKLAKEVLDRGDELPPQTRALLTTIDTFTAKLAEEHGIDRGDARFTQRELRATTGWGHTQTKVHLARLVELEHVAVHSGGAGRKSRTYGYDAEWSGVNGSRSWGGRPVVGPSSRPLSPNDLEDMPVAVGVSEEARLGKTRRSASYSQTRPSK